MRDLLLHRRRYVDAAIHPMWMPQYAINISVVVK
jgi:hypothetical protein